MVPQRPCKVAGWSRLDWIYVLLLCMQDGTVATGDMSKRAGRYSGKSL